MRLSATRLSGTGGNASAFSFADSSAKAHYEALLAAGVTPNLNYARRIDRAFTTLSNAGIKDELILGCYFGSDGQVASGLPIPFAGTARAIQGTFSRGANGWTTDQTATQGLAFTIPDTRTGTVFLDTVPGGVVNSASGGGICVVSNASGTFWNNSHIWGYDGTNKTRLSRIAVGNTTHQTSLVAQSTVERALPRNSRQFRVHGFTYGTNTVKSWVDGAESNPATAASPVQSVSLTNVSLFARSFNSGTFSSVDRYVGTIRSVLVFNRELTTTEARAASVAEMILDPAPTLMIIEGDSTAEEVDFLTRTVDHWGKKLEAKSNWSNVRQVNIATSGMACEGYDATYQNWNTQAAWLTPAALGKNVWFSILGSINDIGQGTRTAAQIYGYQRDYAAKARAVGMKTMIHVCPTPIAPTWDAAKVTRSNDVRAQILANAVADGFNAVIDASVVVDLSNAANRVDDVHANGTGNDLWATAINAAVTP